MNILSLSNSHWVDIFFLSFNIFLHRFILHLWHLSLWHLLFPFNPKLLWEEILNHLVNLSQMPHPGHSLFSLCVAVRHRAERLLGILFANLLEIVLQAVVSVKIHLGAE